jgi:hypothetical protein
MVRPPKPRTVKALTAHHKRSPHRVADLELAKVAFAALSDRWGPNLIANAEKKCAEVLSAAGMPTDANEVFRTPRGGAFLGLAKKVTQQGKEIGSEEWYAAKILYQICELKRARASGNADQIEHEALHLGALMKEANIVLMARPKHRPKGRSKAISDDLLNLDRLVSDGMKPTTAAKKLYSAQGFKEDELKNKADNLVKADKKRGKK